MTLRKLLTIVKYAVAALLLWLVLSQIDQAALINILRQSRPEWLLAALLVFCGAQLMSVLRMNAYYKAQGKPLDFGFSLRLHYVALFYNVMVPGGVGGDGYRVYILKRHFDYGMKEGAKIQLLMRLNGLLVIVLSVLLAAAYMMPQAQLLCVFGVGVVIAGYMVVIPKALPLETSFEWRALPYSLLVQGGNLLAAACLLNALGVAESYIAYLALFQVAMVAGMIPITIGGLGLREMTFVYGVPLMNGYLAMPIAPEIGVTLALLYFALTLLQSLVGVVWLSRFEKVKA